MNRKLLGVPVRYLLVPISNVVQPSTVPTELQENGEAGEVGEGHSLLRNDCFEQTANSTHELVKYSAVVQKCVLIMLSPFNVEHTVPVHNLFRVFGQVSVMHRHLIFNGSHFG